MKNSTDGAIRRFDPAEERTSEVGDTLIEMTQNET